jgi:hypothetical protein
MTGLGAPACTWARAGDIDALLVGDGVLPFAAGFPASTPLSPNVADGFGVAAWETNCFGWSGPADIGTRPAMSSNEGAAPEEESASLMGETTGGAADGS